MKKDADGSILDGPGRVIYFSPERFKRDICLGDCCFVCGASPNAVPFNNEHVIPRWLLRRFGLFARRLTLPNETEIEYGKHVVPCCEDCNALLGRTLEHPVRDLMTNGFKAFHKQLPAAIPTLFQWLCLTVFKTHYRDRLLRTDQDRRAPDNRIADFYDWGELHHIHAVARAAYTGCQIEPSVIGSMHIFEVTENQYEESFDFVDLYPAQAVLVRVNDIAIVAVLNDSCGASNGFEPYSKRITAAVSAIQLREILAHLAAINLHVKHRPTYWTRAGDKPGECAICAKVPDLFEMETPDAQTFGSIMMRTCGGLVRQMANPDKEEILRAIEDGQYTFLFNADGSFNKDSLRFLEAGGEKPG